MSWRTWSRAHSMAADEISPRVLVRPTPQEVLGGMLVGVLPKGETLNDRFAAIGPEATPRATLERIVRNALERPPCVVSFSGGRDSSVLLALAAAVARREGLPPPIPLTKRYPGSAEADETEWQELVVSHLGLTEWERVEIRSEFDAVGEVAQRFMRRYGIAFGQLHSCVATFGLARGGSCIDGEGGDEIFGFRRASPIKRVLHRTVPIRRKATAKWLFFYLAPYRTRVKNWKMLLSETIECSRWLRPEALALFLDALATELASEPLDARKAVWWHLQRRQIAGLQQNLQTIAEADFDVLHVQPFLDRDFVATYARMEGRLGTLGRTDAMRALFSDLLPDAVLARQSKAFFNHVYLGAATKEFASRWQGEGVDSRFVDIEALRSEWQSDWPATGSCGLLQSAWLASVGSSPHP
jgi:asparagine synthetase B (glutamine-hydrolysing)